MKIAVISSSNLINRADVKYNIDDETKEYDVWKIAELKEIIVRDPMCYGFQYSKVGIPMIRISDLKEPFIDYSKVAYVSEMVHKKLKKTSLKKMDILMSVRGVSIGKIGIFLGEFEEANISPNIIIIRLKDKKIAPYVCMTLMSDVAKRQIKRAIAGSSKPTITAPMIESIEIPIPSDDILEKFNVFFTQCVERKSKEAYLRSKFEKRFTEIFKSDFEKSKKISYEECLLDEKRWDPHYHNPQYKGLRQYLNEIKSEKLGKVLTPVSELVKKGKNDEKIGYIEISDINCISARIENITVDFPPKLPKGGKVILSNGDILISKVRPYRNCVTIYREDLPFTVTASKNGLSVYRGKTEQKLFYILSFLRSVCGKLQIEMYQSGTSYPTVSDDDLENILIPEIDKELEKEMDMMYKEILDNYEIQSNLIVKMLEVIKSIF